MTRRRPRRRARQARRRYSSGGARSSPWWPTHPGTESCELSIVRAPRSPALFTLLMEPNHERLVSPAMTSRPNPRVVRAATPGERFGALGNAIGGMGARGLVSASLRRRSRSRLQRRAAGGTRSGSATAMYARCARGSGLVLRIAGPVPAGEAFSPWPGAGRASLPDARSGRVDHLPGGLGLRLRLDQVAGLDRRVGLLV